ncbi:MAG: methyltransferase domain-containing protein [Myxococcota bacterium]
MQATAKKTGASVEGRSVPQRAATYLLNAARAALPSDPEVAEHLIAQILSRQPDYPSALRVQAESLARQGRHMEALQTHRKLAAVEGRLLPNPALEPCNVCGEAHAELCWIGELETGTVRRWFRCAECRTVRCMDPDRAGALSSRAARLNTAPMTETRLMAALQEADVLIERIRQEGYGTGWLNRPGSHGRAQLVSVGSGWGALLAAATWRGFEAQGVEPTLDAARWARESLGVCVWSSINELPQIPIDVLVLEDGIGEADDPIELLDLVCRQLVSGGVLAITVPCVEHPLRRARGFDDPRWQRPDARLFFERTSISLALLRAGLQPTRSWNHPTRSGEIIILAKKTG